MEDTGSEGACLRRWAGRGSAREVLHAAFIPFGDITDIQILLDYETGESFQCLSCSDS